jgi:hypothetical protein
LLCEEVDDEEEVDEEEEDEEDEELYSLSFTAVPFFSTQAVISWFRLLLPPMPPPPSWM